MKNQSVRGTNRDIAGCAVAGETHRQVQKEEALQESEAKYQFLFENSRDMIYFSSVEGDLLQFNSALAETLGYTREELLATNLEALCIDPPGREFLDLVKGQDFVKDYPVSLKRKDGKVISVLATACVMRDQKGMSLGYQGIFRDVTAQRLAEEKIRSGSENLKKSIEGTIRAIALTVEIRDPYTACHHTRVAKLACAIAKEMGASREQVEGVKTAAAIHDIGKISIPAEILSKPGRMNEIEFSLIKTHPRVGFEILKTIEFPWPVAEIVLQHHERMNGTGYLSGLMGQEILLEARILGVADVVEAMASHRPYRPAFPIAEALREIACNRGTLYDPEVVDACLSLFFNKGFRLD
ncbi:MAG: PAS domain S-box protein [Bacillota bacterium]|nr:PAS domain S-box protein [Bacillota bacterium]